METKNYSEEIATSINEYLTERGLNYSFDDEEGIFTFIMEVDAQLSDLLIMIYVEEDMYRVYGVVPKRLESDDHQVLSRVTEFMNRLNFELFFGNFELNIEYGIMRYKITQDCNGSHVSNKVIQNSIDMCINMYVRNLDKLLQCIYTDKSVKEIVEE